MNDITSRILHIITGLATGGAEQVLYNLFNGGLTKYFSNHVISLSDEGTIGPRIRELGVPITTLDIRRGFPSFSALSKLRRVTNEVKPDIIQGWMYHGNLAATLARSLAVGRPMLAWSIHHSLNELRHEKPMTRQVIRANRYVSSFPESIHYCSQLSQKLHEKFGFVAKNGLFIPNGINTQRFLFSSAARQRIRTELDIAPNAQVIGHVARFHPMKNHQIFIQAATDLAIRYPDVHFLLVGRDIIPDNAIITPMIPMKVSNRFHLLGERSDVPNLMSAMDIFCLSSSWGEAFPLVLGEAMVTGIPCVATDIGDSAIIIGDTGVIVPPGNKHALTTGLESILTMSPKERSALGTKAQARIEANYTLEVIVDQYIMMYEQLVAAK
ncbi:MAG: glycosyltransferase [Candidatus Electrothrix sp. ATG2]|nr:glycosyltransferase [Candidatus Electrothrix sp. ATG2]